MGTEALEGAKTIIDVMAVIILIILGVFGVIIARRAWRESKQRAGKKIDKFAGPEQKGSDF